MFNYYTEFFSGVSLGFEIIPIEIVEDDVEGYAVVVDLLIFRVVLEYLKN